MLICIHIFMISTKVMAQIDHLKISTSAYRQRNQHRHSNIQSFTQNKQPLELKAGSRFVKHIIFNEVAAYRLEACDFARKCFAKISCLKFPDNLKRATVKIPYGKTGINSKTCNFSEKNFHHRRLLVNILELSLFLQEGLHELRGFFYKTEACVLQGCNFIILF